MGTRVCKLTGSRGQYVKAHLIPKALTRPEVPGLPFIQAGLGNRPVRRWSSWYDNQLVTQEGENLLTSFDTWAIEFLRKERLVWSGWGPMLSIQALSSPIPGTDWSFRIVQVPDPDRLRLFFLSLLWRAAASNRFEFAEVRLPPRDLERLREVIVTGKLAPLSFYPASLTQLSTLGLIHNHTPIAQTKIVPPVGDERERRVPIFRFYFDGLIVHFHRHAQDDGYTDSIGNLVVGAKATLAVSAVPFETSFQRENLANIMLDAHLHNKDGVPGLR